jgi:hypothetical protein
MRLPKAFRPQNHFGARENLIFLKSSIVNHAELGLLTRPVGVAKCRGRRHRVSAKVRYMFAYR